MATCVNSQGGLIPFEFDMDSETDALKVSCKMPPSTVSDYLM